MINWQELERKYYIQISPRTPITIVKGKGARVWDDAGKEYLDFVAGWAVDSLGHCHPAVVEAITKQANTLIQTSNQYYTVPQLQLAQLLVEHSCLDRLYVCNSGAEADEGAVKLARRYGALKLNGAYEVITAFNSFHGRTLAMTAATGQEKFQKPYYPLTPGFKNVPFDDVPAIKSATTDKTCAIMIEPIQGEGGVNIPADNYLKEVRSWCDQKGILLILDEVQTGIGRTGKLFAFQHTDILPDVLTLAKGLGSGVPVGACLARGEAANTFKPGNHGSTFGGNPLACTAGLATLTALEAADLPANATRTGDFLRETFSREFANEPSVLSIRGIGLMIGIELDRPCATLVARALEQGLLINVTAERVIRLLPPLIMNLTEARQLADILIPLVRQFLQENNA